MPRPRLPPTPLSSTDIAGRDKLDVHDMDSIEILPPPAMATQDTRLSLFNTNPHSSTTADTSPPPSPIDRRAEKSLQRKRTYSGSTRPRPESQYPTESNLDSALPPPPSRARKIIQMKPKCVPTTATEQTRNSSKSASSISQSEPASGTAAPTKRKHGQPATTSAAGRKIARKTAHSIIERRRRSKMNEEFGVLKDMIPACAGTEMHKLAILQAGIEYVKYLEDCIDTLKTQNENLQSRQPEIHGNNENSETEGESMECEGQIQPNPHDHSSSSPFNNESENVTSSTKGRSTLSSIQQQLTSTRKSSIATNATCSTLTSPELYPIHSVASEPAYLRSTNSRGHTRAHNASNQHYKNYSTSPTSVTAQTPAQSGISPAFGAFHFSPDLSRTSAWTATNGPVLYNKSPQILPLPQAALPFSTLTTLANHNISATNLAAQDDGHAEATATAALLMMTTDRRGSPMLSTPNSGRGMSVKDLLSS